MLFVRRSRRSWCLCVSHALRVDARAPASDPKMAASAETVAGFQERLSHAILRYRGAVNLKSAERMLSVATAAATRRPALDRVGQAQAFHSAARRPGSALPRNSSSRSSRPAGNSHPHSDRGPLKAGPTAPLLEQAIPAVPGTHDPCHTRRARSILVQASSGQSAGMTARFPATALERA